jgi:hypothetical protein
MFRKLSLGLIMALAACGSARLIQQTPQGGTLELQGDRNKAMEDANNQMAAQCGPNNYTIVQQGEEPVGTDTYTQADQQTTDRTSRNGRRNRSNTQTQEVTSTRTAVAWRVHYQCNGAMPAAGQMPPQQMPPQGPPGGPPPDQGGPPPDQGGPPPAPAPGY